MKKSRKVQYKKRKYRTRKLRGGADCNNPIDMIDTIIKNLPECSLTDPISQTLLNGIKRNAAKIKSRLAPEKAISITNQKAAQIKSRSALENALSITNQIAAMKKAENSKAIAYQRVLQTAPPDQFTSPTNNTMKILKQLQNKMPPTGKKTFVNTKKLEKRFAKLMAPPNNNDL
jgi:hypothetical protein